MTQAIREVADNLEAHASNRADFRDVSDAQRWHVARWLVIARSQAQNSGEATRDGAYGWHMIEKRSRYYHACGDAGISMTEAKSIWWSVVHDNPAPCDRGDLI